MPEPVAVIISDVHYNVHTLKLADAAVRMAIEKANDLETSLIVSGDLHDTKANLRGECVNAMIKTFSQCIFPPYILVGNHDRINEKAEAHSLNFLSAYANVIDLPCKSFYGYLVPYYHDPDELRTYLKTIPAGSTVIMHQGLTSSNSGDYIQDKSAINPEDVQDFRAISGHYHTRQDIKIGRPRKGSVGLFSYVGNPYTLTYGEAYDPPKGFQILMDDGTLEFVSTNLRKHVIVEYDLITDESKWSSGPIMAGDGINDLAWVKIKGTKEQLAKINKIEFLKDKGIPQNVRFDLIPTDTNSQVFEHKNLTQGPLLDSLIDSLTNTSDERKQRLKDIWKLEML